jgi:hypothetical protein
MTGRHIHPKKRKCRFEPRLPLAADHQGSLLDVRCSGERF